MSEVELLACVASCWCRLMQTSAVMVRPVAGGEMADWEVSDELWARIKPLLPVVQRRSRHPGRRRLDDRACLNGILFGWPPGCAGTGCHRNWATARTSETGSAARCQWLAPCWRVRLSTTPSHAWVYVALGGSHLHRRLRRWPRMGRRQPA